MSAVTVDFWMVLVLGSNRYLSSITFSLMALQRSSSALSSDDSPVRDVGSVLTEAARRVLSRRFRVVRLVRDAYNRMLAHSNVLSAVLRDLRTMLRLLVRWAARSYRGVSAGSLVVIVGALLYFIAPIDLIPDALGGIGFVDDVTVISTAVDTIRSELRQFRQWERNVFSNP